MADVNTSTTLHVEDSGGDGRPVILIHGWPLSAEAWGHNVDAIKNAGFRTIAYDRRGFGRSEKPEGDYDYDTLAKDLDEIIDSLSLSDVTLVGFSMGGGEVARYVGNHGEDKIHSLVFASAVPPYLYKGDDNPEGPVDDELAGQFEDGVKNDRENFMAGFVNDFYSADGELKVSEDEVSKAKELCGQGRQEAVLGTMEAWATTDFRKDLDKITKPTLVIHGDSDGVVPFEGSGKRTHEQVDGAELVLIEGAPHGVNVSHAEEWNNAVVEFLKK
ncbi:alpha/beta hydrolase [Nocardioidaceae bacterium]|nr:alpha/beta hydrolase [Nocardioidaceae bacterium]